MEDDICAGHVRPHRFAIADIHFDEPRTARRERAGEVLRYATDERVEGDHSARASGEHGVGEVRADHSRAAGDDDARAGESAHFLIRFTFIVR